jgi:hypothetical protein
MNKSRTRVGCLHDVGTGPECTIDGFRVVIEPLVLGRICSVLGLSRIEPYPAFDLPWLPTLGLAAEIPTHVSDEDLVPIVVLKLTSELPCDMTTSCYAPYESARQVAFAARSCAH